MDWQHFPPLSALRAFTAFAQTRSVQSAGAALNVSHAAISQQMRNLETHLGVSLLDRNGRNLILTTEGQQLALALTDGFDTIGRAIDELTGRDALRPLQISTTPSFAAGWLMPRLASFRAAHPDISLMIDPTADRKTLTPGGIDVALRYGSGSWQGLDAELLISSPIVVVAAPDLIGTEEISDPNELSQYHWLQELGTNEASYWFGKFGIQPNPGKGMTALPGNMMIEAARQGQGVAITAGIFVQEDIDAGRLRLLFQDQLGHGYHLVTRSGVLRPSLRHFCSWIRREARNR